MPSSRTTIRYGLAIALGLALALALDFLLVPAGWRMLMGLALCLSLGFASVFFAAITDRRMR